MPKKTTSSPHRVAVVQHPPDPERASAAKRTLDIAGHHGRPDIFRLEVNRDARPPVAFGSDSLHTRAH